MIGLKLELHLTGENLKDILCMLGMRLGAAVLFSAVTCWWLPLPDLARHVLLLAYLGSPSAIATIYAKRLGYEGSFTADVTMLNLLLAIGLIPWAVSMTYWRIRKVPEQNAHFVGLGLFGIVHITA